VRGCAELYLRTARMLMEEAEAGPVHDELRDAAARAQALLADGGRRTANAAAWELRHAFDRILAMPRRSSGRTWATGQQPQSTSPGSRVSDVRRSRSTCSLCDRMAVSFTRRRFGRR